MTYFTKTAMLFLFVAGLAAGCRPGPPGAGELTQRLGLLGGARYREPEALKNYVLSEIAYENGDLSTAVPLLEAAVEADDGDPFLTLRLAELYFEVGNREGAEKQIAQVLKAHPRDPDVWLVQSRGYAEIGDIKRALAAAREVVALSPNHLEGALWLASLLVGNRENERALEVLRTAYDYHPRSVPIALAYCRLLLGQGQYRSAEAVIRQIGAPNTLPADLWIALGRAAHGLGFDQAAAAHYEQAFALAPPSDADRLALIDVYLAKHDIQAATRHLFALEISEETDARPHMVRASRWERAGRLFDARRVIVNGLELIPKSGDLALYLAFMEIRLARLEDAALLLEDVDPAWTPRQHACRKVLLAAVAAWPSPPPRCDVFDPDRAAPTPSTAAP